jgi:hypothetical protein
VHDHRNSNVSVDVGTAIAEVPTFVERDTSICRFVIEHRGQSAPRGVSNVFGQHRARKALHVEAFDRDPAETVNEIAGNVVQVVSPLRSDMSLELGESCLSLRPSLRSTLAAGNSTLPAAQFTLDTFRQSLARSVLPLLRATKLERPKSIPTLSGPARSTGATSTWKSTYHLPPCRVTIADFGLLGSSRCHRTLISPGTPTNPILPDFRSVRPSPTRALPLPANAGQSPRR